MIPKRLDILSRCVGRRAGNEKVISRVYGFFFSTTILLILIATFSTAHANTQSELTKKAENGDSEAQNNLAINYYNEENYSEALYWFKEADKNGNIVATHNLGILHEYGNGVEKNINNAIGFYLRSAENGYIRAQSRLGNIYYDGIGVKADRKKATGWLLRASINGDPSSQYKLGRHFAYNHELGDHQGQEKIEAYKKAVHWFSKAAEQNYQDAKRESLINKKTLIREHADYFFKSKSTTPKKKIEILGLSIYGTQVEDLFFVAVTDSDSFQGLRTGDVLFKYNGENISSVEDFISRLVNTDIRTRATFQGFRFDSEKEFNTNVPFERLDLKLLTPFEEKEDLGYFFFNKAEEYYEDENYIEAFAIWEHLAKDDRWYLSPNYLGEKYEYYKTHDADRARYWFEIGAASGDSAARTNLEEMNGLAYKILSLSISSTNSVVDFYTNNEDAIKKTAITVAAIVGTVILADTISSDDICFRPNNDECNGWQTKHHKTLYEKVSSHMRGYAPTVGACDSNQQMAAVINGLVEQASWQTVGNVLKVLVDGDAEEIFVHIGDFRSYAASNNGC